MLGFWPIAKKRIEREKKKLWGICFVFKLEKQTGLV